MDIFSLPQLWWFWDDHYCFWWAEESLFAWHILYIIPNSCSLSKWTANNNACFSISQQDTKAFTCIFVLPSGCFHSIYIMMLFFISGTNICRWMNKQLGQYYFVSCQLWMSHCFLRFIRTFSSKKMWQVNLCSFLCLLQHQDTHVLKGP